MSGPFLRFNARPPFSFDLPQDPLLNQNAIHNQLRLQQRVDALESKPARDLTQEEARDLTAYYALAGDIILEKQVTFDTYGKPVFPKPNDKVTLGLEIAGVSFTPDNPLAAKWKATKPVDLRTVALLVRLSQSLKSGPWGVTAIYWGGLGIGKTGTVDQHAKGFALDFHGADTRRGTYKVERDWGTKPITLPNGKVASQWPATETHTYYRLKVRDSSPEKFSTDAGAFFNEVYRFLTGEARDGSNPAKPTSIGEASYIMHPDHPEPSKRPGHSNHIHAEIDR
jgi:hypothetical protein